MAIADAYRREKGRMPHAPARQAGNWKLAYADFLTALVALFLVLWLVNDRPVADKVAFAGYFRGDQETRPISAVPGQRPRSEQLADNINTTVLLNGFRHNVIALPRNDGVRIELMDLSRQPMFATAETSFTPAGIDALSALAVVLQTLPGNLEIEGHTDAFPLTGSGGDNWTLSLGRADAARKALVAAGIEPVRIQHVSGFGETRPLRPEEPHRAENRRVTIVLQVTE